MLIASNFSFMFLQCSLYARLRLGKKLHWPAIIEKLRAIDIYNAFQSQVIFKIFPLPFPLKFNSIASLYILSLANLIIR